MGQWPLHVHAVACLAACCAALLYSLSLPRATGTTQTKVLAGPRRDKTLAKPELYYAALNILCASTEAKPRGRRSQQLAPRCTSYVTGQFAASC